jgi:DNA-binding MarR family transcriptional regulator
VSRSLPDRPANTAVLMREAFAVLNNVVLQRLAGQGHEVVRTAHGAVFQFLDDDGTTVSVLAERAGVSKQAMADLVLHLESHGYVTRNPDPTDGRAKLVLLTDLGNEVMKIAGAAVPEIETKLANLVGERRLKQLREDLQVIIDEHWS